MSTTLQLHLYFMYSYIKGWDAGMVRSLQEQHASFDGYQAGDVIRDHDAALGYVLTYDKDAFPSFADLPIAQRRPVRFTQAELAFNHGWLVQVEATPLPLMLT